MMRLLSPLPHAPSRQGGFSLVEMIVVIVITGIIGGIVAVFLKLPVQQYVDVARRADMTDIADTALRRIARDVRLALPNSVRVRGALSGAGSCNGSEACFLEFLPTSGGGRYRAGPPGDELVFSAADTGFDVLGPMPAAVAVGDQIVVYNLGITGADAYAGNAAAADNRRAVSGVGASSISITSVNRLPFDSPGHRFHVVTTPVTYACDGAGTLWRYWGYAIQPAQTSVDSIAELDALVPSVITNRARLATSVGSCSFTYDAFVVAQRSGLVTMRLAITKPNPGGADETVTLYSATHVSNQP